MPTVAERQDVRDAILDATDRLLARYGYKKMTMDDLAQEVGIGKGTIYLHFAGKEEVVLSHIDRIVERLLARMRDIAASRAPAAERLQAMLAERVLQRFDAVQDYRQSLADVLAAIRPSLLARRKQHFAAEAEVLARVLAEGARAGELRPVHPAQTAEAFIIATNALLPYGLSPRELGDRERVADEVRQVAELLLHGVVRR